MGLNQVLVCRRYLGDQYLQGSEVNRTEQRER